MGVDMGFLLVVLAPVGAETGNAHLVERFEDSVR
jgi:hypothetical protein